MQTRDFDYELPPERIAQAPIEPRDESRLMHIDRRKGTIRHYRFRDLATLLQPQDLLVANDSRVIPARAEGVKQPSQGRVEVLLLRPSRSSEQSKSSACEWTCLIRGRVRAGQRIQMGQPVSEHEGELDAEGGLLDSTIPASPPLELTVLHCDDDGTRRVKFNRPPLRWFRAYGSMPIPPYIRTAPEDPERYQTLYAEKEGSAAAPTAGLHFTPRVFDTLEAKGIDWAPLTLHVGLDTFRPLTAEQLEEHRLHSEWLEVGSRCARSLAALQANNGRLVAVGTTSVRALESSARWEAGSDHGTHQEGFDGKAVSFPGRKTSSWRDWIDDPKIRP